VLAQCLRAALSAGIGGRIVLSGVDDAHAEAATAAGAVRLRARRTAPFLDLAAARAAGGVLARASANTRYQLRRSARAYAEDGEVRIARAASAAEAQDWLAALAVLHQARWRARGRPGAFAEPAFARFHRSLVARGHGGSAAEGRTELLRVTAGAAVIGYLYNFVARGRVAMELYAAEGLACYDFLAGADRYKTSLADGAQTLHWLDLAPARSVLGLAFRARAAVTARFDG
jgi:CelD/BcsL family acetyltransferase involved in cellulose biosynthesis